MWLSIIALKKTIVFYQFFFRLEKQRLLFTRIDIRKLYQFYMLLCRYHGQKRPSFNLSNSVLFPSTTRSNTVLRLVCRKTTSIISGYSPKTKSASANRWKPKNPTPSRNRRVSHRAFYTQRFVWQTDILGHFVFYSFDRIRYVK